MTERWFGRSALGEAAALWRQSLLKLHAKRADLQASAAATIQMQFRLANPLVRENVAARVLQRFFRKTWARRYHVRVARAIGASKQRAFTRRSVATLS